jgi:predicted small lipoprotein YifL
MNRLRLATLLLAALPLAGCGNKGPLTLQPQSEAPPPTPAQAASEMLPEASTVAPPAASTVTAPADPTGSSETIVPPPAEGHDGTPGTPR